MSQEYSFGNSLSHSVFLQIPKDHLPCAERGIWYQDARCAINRPGPCLQEAYSKAGLVKFVRSEQLEGLLKIQNLLLYFAESESLGLGRVVTLV